MASAASPISAVAHKGPLPRDPRELIGYQTMRVDRDCLRLWEITLKSGRYDNFIGIIDTPSWTCYMAPCFGVLQNSWKHELVGKMAIYKAIRDGEFPADTPCLSNSTSTADKTMVATPKKVLDGIYGEHGVCYVPLETENFDGHSHQAMHRWVTRRLNPLVKWETCLGFAIQRDDKGYFIRHSSTLNQHPGQLKAAGTPTFQPQMVPWYFWGCIKWGEVPYVDPLIEPRDLPMAWAILLEETLERDLGVRRTITDQIQSRGENQWSRRSRFTLVSHASGSGGASASTSSGSSAGATAAASTPPSPPPLSSTSTDVKKMA